MCHKRVIPQGAQLKQGKGQVFRTLAGAYSSLGALDMREIRLPSFDKNRIIDEHEFEIFDGDCKYDVILGGDFLAKVGMNLLYKTLSIEWLGITIPMETLGKAASAAEHVQNYIGEMVLVHQLKD